MRLADLNLGHCVMVSRPPYGADTSCPARYWREAMVVAVNPRGVTLAMWDHLDTQRMFVNHRDLAAGLVRRESKAEEKRRLRGWVGPWEWSRP